MKPEAALQSQLWSWWQYAHKGFGLSDHRVLFMVANGAYLGAGSKVLASGKSVPLSVIRFKQLERMGFVQGVSDMLMIVPRGTKVGLSLELKSAKGRVSDDQEQMLALFSVQGWATAVAYSFDEAVRAITNYLLRGDPLLSK